MSCPVDNQYTPQNCAGAIGVVSGSGLNLDGLMDHVDRVMPFSAFDGMASGALPGHLRTFTFGRVGSASVVLQSGRYHFYEGLGYRAINRPVDLLYEWGIRTIVYTNVAGGLEPALDTGALVAVNRLLTWPFTGWTERPDTIAPDLVLDGADATGTYVWVHGPSYETPAEVRLLQRWGGSVVGMSTAPEVQRCRQLGIRTAVISCVTNSCCRPQPLTHDDVIAEAGKLSGKLVNLLRRALDSGSLR